MLSHKCPQSLCGQFDSREIHFVVYRRGAGRVGWGREERQRQYDRQPSACSAFRVKPRDMIGLRRKVSRVERRWDVSDDGRLRFCK